MATEGTAHPRQEPSCRAAPLPSATDDGAATTAPPAASPVSGGSSPRRHVTLVARSDEPSRALAAYLCDADVACTSLIGFSLEQLLVLETSAVVVFFDGFALSDLLPELKVLHARRPGLALVFIADYAARSALGRAFGASARPPAVLRRTVSAAVIHAALAEASELGAPEPRISGPELPATPAALGPEVAEAVKMLTQNEPLRDRRFDRLLPASLRAASNQFWTPLEVVAQAGAWFDELGVRSVVDIGSGVGKFCLAGAFTCSCSFVGIEQRAQLVAVARNLSRCFGLEERVAFIEGRFGEVATPPADCYYLYNPFEENLLPVDEALDGDVELSAERFRRDLRCYRALVDSLPIGAYVLTYNGVGGRVPASLAEVRVQRELPAVLRLLQKVRDGRALGASGAVGLRALQTR